MGDTFHLIDSSTPLWSELDSGGTTEHCCSELGLDIRARSIRLAVPHEAVRVGSCTTCVRLKLDRMSCKE